MEYSSKKAKTPGGGMSSIIVSCLVDGCTADLGLGREYHRRHKVCEPHSKTSKVTIAGREQRFCQQCSRFHSLAEFDQGKRSCRKRLDGHNRRRRKLQPQSDPLSKTATTFLSSQQDIARILSLNSNPQIHPMAPAGFKLENQAIGHFNNQPPALNYVTARHHLNPPPPQNTNHFNFLQRQPSSNRSRALSLLSSSLPMIMHPQEMLSEASGHSTTTHHFQGMFNNNNHHANANANANSSSSSSTEIKHQTLSFRWD